MNANETTPVKATTTEASTKTVPAKASSSPRTVKAPATVKTVADVKATVRTSHTDCDHSTAGREGKIARAKCRRELVESAKAAA